MKSYEEKTTALLNILQRYGDINFQIPNIGIKECHKYIGEVNCIITALKEDLKNETDQIISKDTRRIIHIGERLIVLLKNYIDVCEYLILKH